MRRLALGTLSLLLALALPRASSGAELPKSTRKNLLDGVVFILAFDSSRGGLNPVSSGSGTVITKDGWILTNYHVAFDYERGRPFAELAVGFTRNPKEKPELSCLADPTSGFFDRALDIAVIKCDRDLAGNPLPAKTSFTPVPIGDSETVDIGDEIYVIGYPGVGGETINFTSGKVSGFIGEDGNTAGDSWIKTEADLAPGNSGGACVNSKGELVGIPSQIHFGDRTGGGYVPKINLIRPVKYAKKFIESSVKMKTIDKAVPVTIPDGVTVTGKLLSADSGRPIPGGLVLFLKPGVKVRDVNEKNVISKLYTKAVTDHQGSFSTDLPLKRGKSYGVWIMAEGYQSIQVDDGVETGVVDNPLYDVGTVELQRKR